MKPVELELATLKALASAMSINPDMAQDDVEAAGVTSADFTSPEMGALFDALALRLREKRPIDVVALAHSLTGRVPRETVADVVTAAEFGVLAERAGQLRDATMRRQMVAALEAALRVARNPALKLTEAAQEAAKAAEALGTVAGKARRASSDLMGVCDELEQVQLGKKEPVLPTGIHPLDAMVGGLQRTLTIVGALPGVGKSALLASIVRNLARRGVTCGVFSLEDAGEWVSKRLLSESAAIPLFVLGNRRLTNGQLNRVMDSASKVGNELNRVWIDDRHGMTTQDIVASAREMITKHGAKAIFVDHLGEIRLNRTDRHDLDIAQALSDLRGLAKAHNVPVVVLCHVKRRDGLSKADEPTLTDFAFSAAVERMARVALALSRPEGTNDLLVSVLKQTGGQGDVSVALPFRGPAGMVANGERSTAADEHYARQEAEMATWGDE